MTKMQHFKNQINESLLRGPEDTTILSSLPPPELHLLMGLVNWVLELLYQVVSKDNPHERMRKRIPGWTIGWWELSSFLEALTIHLRGDFISGSAYL